MAEIITSEIEIQSGVISSGLTVDTGGAVTVLSGGTVTDTEAVNYGYLWVEEGGFIQNISLKTSGNAFVDGGSAENLTMETGGQADIMGGVLNSATILSKGIGAVYTGASALNVAVSAGGRYLVYGGYAENTIISSGGSFTVQMSGGIADKTTVEAGGSARIVSGGEMWETILNGARLDVISGTIRATTINGGELHVSSGGPELASGYADNTVVNAGLFIVSGATAASTTVNSGGSFLVSGGTAQNTTMSGGEFIASDAEVQSTTVSGGEFIASNAEVQSTTVSGGAVQFIGGTADKTDIFSGTVLVSGGTVQNTTLGSGTSSYSPFGPDGPIFYPVTTSSFILDPSSFIIYPDSTYYHTGNGEGSGPYLVIGGATVSLLDAAAIMAAGGEGNPVQVANAADETSPGTDPESLLTLLNGALAVSTTVNSGGRIDIHEGALAVSTTVNSGGRMDILNGATASNTTVSNGMVLVSSGGIAHTLTITAGTAGTASVLAGGLVVSATVSAGLLTLDGGTASSTTIDGGTMHVLNGGAANTVSMRGKGFLLVDNGTIRDATVFGGTLSILNGGRANDTTLFSGCLEVESGTIHGATVTGGTVRIKDGGTLSGAFTIASEYVDFLVESGGVIAFDIAGMAPGFEAESSGLAYIWGAPTYTLTVSDTQAAGVYALSAEAGGFRDTITVRNQFGVQLGTLTVGNAVFLNNQFYTLRVTDNVLNLTVSAEAPVPPNAPKTVYVKADWADLAAGTVVELEGGISATIGLNAFATGREATNAVAADGTVVVAGGNVPFEYGISRDTVALNGATVSQSAVTRNGTLTLNDGSFGTGITVSNYGMLTMNAGSIGSDLTVSRNASLTMNEGATASGITVSEHGSMLTMNAGSIASDLTVSSFSSLTMNEGSSATNLTVTDSTFIANGICRDVTVAASTVSLGGTCENLTFNGGVFTVNAGGVCRDAAFSGNSSWVHVGGFGENITVAGGLFMVEDGGVCKNLTVNGGTFTVNAGGVCRDVTTDRSMVFVNGVCENITVSGNTFTVRSGGVVRDLVVTGSAYCTARIEEGGVLTGTGRFGAGMASLTINGTLDFDISGMTESTSPLFTIEMIILGTPSLTITVSDDQTQGEYVLADFYEYQDRSILTTTFYRIVNTAGESLGTLTVGGGATINGQSYILYRQGDQIRLRIRDDSGTGTKTTVYVNSEWSDLAAGSTVEVDGTLLTIGEDAFASIVPAEAEITSVGVITIVGGTYSAEYLTRNAVVRSGTLSDCTIAGASLILNRGAAARNLSVQGTLIVDEGATLTYSSGEDRAFGSGSTVIVNGTFEFDISDVVSTLQTEDIKFSGLDSIYGRPQYVFVDDSESLPLVEGTVPGAVIPFTQMMETVSSFYYTLPIGIDQLLNLDRTLSIKRNGKVYKIKNNGYVISTSPSEAQPKGTTTDQGLALFSGMAFIDSRYYKINILNAENGGICITFTVNKFNTNDVYLNSDWSNKFYHDVVHLVSGGTASYLNNAFDDADYAVEVSKKHKLTIEGGTYSFSGKNLQASQVVVKAGVVILDVLQDPDQNCEVILESGATGIDLTVKRLEVKDGAVCKNITVRNSCTLDLKSGGVLTGTGSFASGSYVTIDGTLVFDVIGLTPADQPLYSGLKYIKGTPTFTLSVGSAQECGLYVLASETGGFDDTISVTDESGVPAGSLAVGDTVLIGDRYYTLHTMNDRLTLSVSTEEPDPLPAVVTVNAAWAGYEAGQPVILADGSTVHIGYNAFADLNTAYNFLSDDGVAIVVGGTFTPEYGIIRKTFAGNGVLIVNATVEKHGCLTVGNGATAESITVLGTLSLSGGGVMAGTITVKNGGVLVLEKDAVQNGTIALTGGTLRLAGYELAELVNPEGFPNTGDITGTGKFKAGANIRIEHLYFDLSGEAPDAAPLFEGISAVMKDRNVGNGFLTVQVGDDQSAGTYYLATDAADTQTVRVKCHDEVLVYNLGISDGPVRVGDRSYRLTLTESNDLYLTIRDYEPADTVYINTTWADLPAEEIVTLVGGGTAVIGVDAFTTIEAGRKALRENGTLVLDGGTFEKLTSGDIGFSNETVVAMSGSTLCVTVESGGSLTLESGAACNQIKVRDNGTLLVKEGAELNVISTGWKIAATFEEGASVTIDGMVNFIFDMSKGNLDLLIDGYSRIQGSPTYRVLLQGPVQLPAYSNGNKKSTVRLFTNVSGFTDSIVIVDSNGVELGTVSTDSYLKIDDEYYAFLSYTGLYVSLTIANYLSLQEVHFNTDWAGLEDGTDVVLADGSTVTIGINAFSDLETAFGAAENTILIEGGSVYFAPDALFLDKVKAFVANEGTVVSGLLQVHYDPKIYYGQPAFDHLTMKQGSLLKDAEIQTGLVYMEGGSGMEGTILVENSTLTARNGIITIGGDADVTFVNSRIEITVKGFDPGENAVIEGASRIKGAPIIYCTVGRDDQTLGTYRIIGDAAGIETIILSFENYYSPPGNGTGIDVSLSDPLGVTKDDRTYKLSLDQNNDLFLTISDYVLPETFYIGAEWSELTDGTVVEVPGGSAVIGLDAFADMQSISPLITVDTELVFVSGSYSFLKSYTRKLVMAGQAVAYDSTLTAGSTLTLRQNGKAYNVVVSENSTLVLEAGAETRDLSVLGSLSVGDGTLAGNLQVYAGGTLTVEAGAKFTGWGVFEEGATITVNGTLDFDISGSAAGGSALYKGLRYVQGDTFYTLTVGTEQTDGFYYLAIGADGFNATVTLTGIDGTVLGTLKVGTSARIYGMVYTLNLGDGILSLTVAAASGTDTRSDVDGNGISDVLFQYTGGDNQTGYWLNGKDTWRSSNCAHPVEWTLLGAYDMDGDGLADSVFVGNGVVVDGVKGAYIGYYKSGIDTDENWVNIDFLENEADNTWVNKIGNLTGNPGANSIVWHCAGLGAIGVWTDGTSEWTQLGIGFDSNWTLVGCGDFNGDGRDSIVMSYLDGTKYYAIGIDGSAVDLGNLNWTGWEVRAIGDFAGDGKDDMILFHKDYGAVVMIADGNLDNYTAVGQLDAKDWFIVGAGDYNGDGKDDLLVRQYSTGMLGYYSACDTSKWVEMGRGVDMDWTVIA